VCVCGVWGGCVVGVWGRSGGCVGMCCFSIAYVLAIRDYKYREGDVGV